MLCKRSLAVALLYGFSCGNASAENWVKSFQYGNGSVEYYDSDSIKKAVFDNVDGFDDDMEVWVMKDNSNATDVVDAKTKEKTRYYVNCAKKLTAIAEYYNVNENGYINSANKARKNSDLNYAVADPDLIAAVCN